MNDKKWYAKSIEEIFKILNTSENGLSEGEAEKRIEKFGLNEIREVKEVEIIPILIRQLKSYFILILLCATLLSFIMGKGLEAFTILSLILLSIFLGFIQEYRAERAVHALKKFFVPKTRVIRSGLIKEIPANKLVPGDVIVLQTGDRVPADARLIEVIDLQVDESILTGESIPVQKQLSVIKEAALAERRNMVFMGTIVTYGRGKAVVVETGANTEIGRIAKLVEEKKEEIPLQIKLTQFIKWLAIFIFFISISLFLLGILTGEKIMDMLLLVTTLAVAAVPEVLPTLITITLAIGVHNMAKNNAIVRKMSAVETLGCVTVICTDKTGTITSNEMTVKKIYISGKEIDVTGIGFKPFGNFKEKGKNIDVNKYEDIQLLLTISALCNDTKLIKENDWYIVGDPTEGALTVLAAKANIWQEELNKKYPRIAELPFSSERKRMTTIHTINNEIFAYTKGAPESVINICKYILKDSKIKLLNRKEKELITNKVKEMAKNGLRVLALAYKKLTSEDFRINIVEKDMVFVGLVGMYDPPRREVKEAIKICKQAGIKVIMLTGDHLLTAITIAKEIGLIKKSEKTLTGEELDKLSDEELEKIVEDVLVYARVTPEHKLRIVKALKKRGHMVAVTGDGVNDAPALKFSDIGVAMGKKGTDVAKEASNIILVDDNFATIVKAVEEGRRIYGNIRKFIRYLLTINLSEIFLVSITKLARLPLPLLPIQVLWLNLVTDGPPALALTAEPRDPEVMKKKPRNPKHGVLHGMKLFLIAAGTLALVTEIIAFIYYLSIGSSIEKARTVTFTVGVMFQLFFAFNCRSEEKSIFSIGITSNKYLILGVFISILMQLLVIYTPFLQPIFGTVSLNIIDWLIIVGLSSTGLFLSPRFLIGRF
ncbi:MAG: calcium-transporting P-type ATPase, PMR1-type [Candidatus Aenigmarchaeota archaeon]|nr:calcium-transporting P-type ATPase, PMR1-type [Candidatus Aenigmarchaeota archaeon]MDW8149271.1 calcium-transporting P-type ATPase, PMR1-type [Candidatus Aenigmarchaeota archaeon]